MTTGRVFTQGERELILSMHRRSWMPALIAPRIGKCDAQDVELLIHEMVNTPPVMPPPPQTPPALGGRLTETDPLHILLGQLVRQHNDSSMTLKALAAVFSHIPQPVEYQILLQRIEVEWSKIPVTAARPPLHVHMFEMLSRMFIFIPRPVLEKRPNPNAE